MNGKNYFSKKILLNLTKNITSKTNEDKRIKELPTFSSREMEVLQHLCIGQSTSEIADNLHLSSRTIEKHKENLFQKTQTASTVTLVVYAFKNKLVSF
jgi:DNA-binding NarL/FixJ family response regulator